MLNKIVNSIKLFFTTLPMTLHGKVNHAINTNNLQLLSKVFNNPKFTYTNKDFYFDYAIEANHPEVLKFLIYETELDPTFDDNFYIIKTFNESKDELTRIFWECKEVKESLKNDCPKIYDELKKFEVQDNISKF